MHLIFWNPAWWAGRLAGCDRTVVDVDSGGGPVSAASADILVLTALGVEANAVTAQSGAKWRAEFDNSVGLPYWTATLKNGLAVALVQLPVMGPVSAAVTTTRAIETLRPKRVVLTGIAAGIGDVALGDILISDQIVDYDLGKIGTAGLAHRWRGYQVDPALLSIARERAGHLNLKISRRTQAQSAETSRQAKCSHRHRSLCEQGCR